MNCSDFCVAESRFLCGIYLENYMKDDFNFTLSLLCDKHKHSLIFVTRFIISIQSDLASLHSIMPCVFLMLFTSDKHLQCGSLYFAAEPPVAVDTQYN